MARFWLVVGRNYGDDECTAAVFGPTENNDRQWAMDCFGEFLNPEHEAERTYIDYVFDCGSVRPVER